jgi:hypothetical protein
VNYKRKKPRRKVRCQLCTPHRRGNEKGDRKPRDRRETQEEE